MTTLIAWGNIRQDYPVERIPSDLLTESLLRTPNENERVQKRHRSRWVAHFLLWELCKTAQIPPALLAQIYRTASGRPQFPVEHIDFNISHSGDWVAVVLNVSRDKSAVGIDIESPRKQRNFPALLQYFASTQEQDWFARQADSATAFYRIWCLREAVLKSQGVGIVKLSEVRHNPQLNLLASAYCPQGGLWFTDELPFYLAVFAADKQLCDARCFAWNDGRLQPYQIKSAVNYSVNF